MPDLVGREGVLEANSRLATVEPVAEITTPGLTGALVQVIAAPLATRLVEELADRAQGTARLLVGHCLSYGSGITFWPLVEVVRQAAHIHSTDPAATARQKLDSLLESAPDVAERVASVTGLGDTTFPVGEIYWATRRLLETLSNDRPLVVIIEDAHWAEGAFLELVDYVAGHLAGPVLLVCSGRPELMETRPDWSKHPGWVHLEIEPLTSEASRHLIANLVGDSNLPRGVQDRLVTLGEGNPFFTEQLLLMLVDDGKIRREGESWRVLGDLAELAVPTSIQAVVSARLERLTREQQAVLEPAAVIGPVFEQQALEELVPTPLRTDTQTYLSEFIRKRLMRAEDERIGRRYHFYHSLIRETAYQRVLKRSRARLHERFVDWSEGVDPRAGRVEQEEIRGYHLEQAYRQLSGLAPLDDHGRAIGARGAVYLGSAGHLAFERGDMAASTNLLGRAAALLPERTPERVALLPELSESLMESGEFAAAERVVNEALDIAAGLDDERLLADAMLTRLLVQFPSVHDLSAWREEITRVTTRWIPLLEQRQADGELAKAWRLAAFVHGTACQFQLTATASEGAIKHARLAGRRRLEARLSAGGAQAVRDGPTCVPEAIRRCEEILAVGLVDQQSEAIATLHLAYLHALAGDIATARQLYGDVRLRLADLGGGGVSAASQASLTIGRVELLAEDASRAEAELRHQFDVLGKMGERFFRPTVGALLAEALCNSGHYQRALEVTAEVEQIVADGDIETQALWCSARSKALVDMGQSDEAVRLARRAVEILAHTDVLVMKGDTYLNQAVVFRRIGLVDEALDALGRARELYLMKGASLLVSRTDRLRAILHGSD